MGSVLVTGGAGFIGSRLVDALMVREDYVCVFDNLSTGSLENVGHWLGDPNFTFIKGDLLSQSDLKKLEVDDYNTIYKERIYTLNDYFTVERWANRKAIRLAQELKCEEALKTAMNLNRKISLGVLETP